MPTKVLFIMLDGCRPDALAQAHTPHLDTLWQTGAYTWSARSVMPSVTLPAHNSIFRSVTPDKHGVGEDNIFRASATQFTSVIDRAALYNKHCAMFYSWEQLRDLAAPGSLKMSYCRAANYGEDNDMPVAVAASEYIAAHQPDFCFLYLGDIDIAGHMFNWMSREYFAAIEANDRAVGYVLQRLAQAGLRDHYTLIVQADHGGHDSGHGTDSPEDMTIPWIINGQNVKPNYAIQAPVGLCDTAATIAHLLNIPRPPEWEGQPVMDALLEL
jgi:predicted AlkP superfamily pyrophosphatase or phosphodiesterase